MCRNCAACSETGAKMPGSVEPTTIIIRIIIIRYRSMAGEKYFNRTSPVCDDSCWNLRVHDRRSSSSLWLRVFFRVSRRSARIRRKTGRGSMCFITILPQEAVRTTRRGRFPRILSRSSRFSADDTRIPRSRCPWKRNSQQSQSFDLQTTYSNSTILSFPPRPASIGFTYPDFRPANKRT